MQVQLRYTNYITLQLQLHYNYNYSCATPHYIQQLWVRWPTRWRLQPLQPLQKAQLQPPFGPSVDSLCHPWFTTTNLSYRFPIFKTCATALCGTTGTKCKECSDWCLVAVHCECRHFIETDARDTGNASTFSHHEMELTSPSLEPMSQAHYLCQLRSRHDATYLAFQHKVPCLRSLDTVGGCVRNGWTTVVLTTSVHRDAAQPIFFLSMPASRCPRCRSHCVQRTIDHHLLSCGQAI